MLCGGQGRSGLVVGQGHGAFSYALKARHMAGPSSSATQYGLHLDAVARVSASISPTLAHPHANQFAHVVPLVAQLGDEAPYGRSPSWLWGQTTRPSQSSCSKAKIKDVVPEWYAMQNPTCQACSIPLLPGLSANHVVSYTRRRSAKHGRRKKTFTMQCMACSHIQTRNKPATASAFPSVRARSSKREQILAGEEKLSSPIPPEAPSLAPTNMVSGVNVHTLQPESKPLQQNVPSLHMKSHLPTTTASTMNASAKAALNRTATPTPPPNLLRKNRNTKADLRALLQQKKQADEDKPKKTGGLADFLSQL